MSDYLMCIKVELLRMKERQFKKKLKHLGHVHVQFTVECGMKFINFNASSAKHVRYVRLSDESKS